MSIARRAVQYGQRRAARKLIRAVPFLGAIVALATLRAAVRRKGLAGGTAHTGLDFVPYVGAIKNALELVLGRDFFPDRTAGPVR